MIKKILLLLLFVLVAIQFIHPGKNKTDKPQPHYIGHAFTIPADVKNTLAKACNDCHSNNTRYPWYTRFQPVHWWLNKHIKNGKKHINYDEYTNHNLRYQYHKMEETIEMVKEDEMPLGSYTRIHKGARLTETEKNLLINWANTVMDTIRAKYPVDSLIRKK